MKKFITVCALTAVAFGLISCAGTVYARRWTVNNADLTDTLSISGDVFTLQRTGSGGTTVWEGGFKDNGDQWIFDIRVWRPPNASERRMDPPVRYLYRVKKFQNGVSFQELIDVVGLSNFQFIQTGDFQIR
jgi:hypothetical protein